MNLQELARREGDPDLIAANAARNMSDAEIRREFVVLLAGAIERVRRDVARMIEEDAFSGSGGYFRRQLRRVVEDNEGRKAAAWESCREIQKRLDAGEIGFEDAIREAHRLGESGLPLHFTIRVEVDPGESTEHNMVSSVQSFTRGHANEWEIEAERAMRIVNARRRDLERRAESEREERNGRESEGFERIGSWFSDVSVIFGKIRHHARLELTRELLESSFAVGDGRAVTWGDATREDHEARIESQIKHAAGTLEDAERHRIAIAMLEESGRECLAEVAAAELAA